MDDVFHLVQVNTAMLIIAAMVCLTAVIVVWKLCKAGVDVSLGGHIKVSVGRSREDD